MTALQARLDLRVAERTAELEGLVLRDPLTGLHNRRFLEQELRRITAASRRHDEPVSLAVVDIDGFKAVNDAYGHHVGDEVLRGVARSLGEGVRAEELVARVGGDEFVIVWPRSAALEAEEACERLRVDIAQLRWPHLAPKFAITGSFGVAGGQNTPLAELWARADHVLFHAKRAGRNRVVVSS